MIRYKYFLTILLLFFSWKINSVYEKVQDEQYSKNVIDFFDDAEKIFSFYNDSLGWKKDFTFEEIKDFATEYYNVICEYPTEYYFYFEKLHKGWEEEIINNNYKIVHKKPAVKLRIIREKITEYYSSAFADLLLVPYLFRIKVKRFDESNYYSKDLKINLRQSDMVVEIEDVIKGEKYFNRGDSLTVSFFGHWFHGAKEEQYFKVDSSYFLPVSLFRIEEKDNYQYKIHMLPDNNFAIYPIIDEIVYTPKDYFGIGEESPWKLFKDFIKKKYVIQ